MGYHFTLLDGGMGRELERISAPFKQPEWSALAVMQAPDKVLEAHNNFIKSGADIITTNSYAMVPFHIGNQTFEDHGFSLIERAVKIAKQAKNNSDKPIKIAGCIPPLFGSYRPDLFNKDMALRILDPLIQAQAPYVDFWLCETISSTEESNIVAHALRTQTPQHDLWLSFNLTENIASHAEITIRSGESIRSAYNSAEEYKAKALLFNCNTPEDTTRALIEASTISSNIQFGAYANSFTPIREAVEANAGLNTTRHDLTPDRYMHICQDWLDLGASIIGGCCGISPNHIHEIDKLRQT